MEQPQPRPGAAGLLILMLLIGLGAGVVLDREILRPGPEAAPPATTPGAGPDVSKLQAAWQLINQNYVDRPALQPITLTYGAISGMVDALGDTGHSRFETPADRQQEASLTQGSFEGIGAEVEMRNDHVTIVTPIDGSPAQKAGLRPGDIILQVNGKSVEGQTLTQVVSQVLGPAGTSVTLTILTPATNDTRDVTIVRARIVLHNVTWQKLPGSSVADLRVSEFSQGVTRDLQAALAAIAQQQVTGIVLDLRDNPGGLVDEAVGTTSSFLKTGGVYEAKDAQGNVTPVPVEKEATTTDLPLVVLVNQGTASAAEIVSGALQDAKRARIVGEQTFGTGTVLQEFPLSDGSALLLATQEWLTPKGRVIWHQGITPDQVVPLSLSTELVIPEALQGETAAQLQASGDAQLLTALAILTGTAPPTPAVTPTP